MDKSNLEITFTKDYELEPNELTIEISEMELSSFNFIVTLKLLICIFSVCINSDFNKLTIGSIM